MEAEGKNRERRMQAELEKTRQFSNEKIIKELLEVVDNFERGLAHASAEGVLEGMQLTQRVLLTF